MADYDLLYQDTYIDALLATANELKAAGYIYKGVATPSTNPGTPTERVAYLASEPGTYTNFGGIVIVSGLYSLTFVSGSWTGTQMSAGSDIEVVQTTGQSVSAVMSQKAVTDEMLFAVEYPFNAQYWENGNIDGSTGGNITSNNAIRLFSYIAVEENQIWHYSMNGSYRLAFLFYKENHVYSNVVQWLTGSGDVAIPTAIKYLRLAIAAPSGSSARPVYNDVGLKMLINKSVNVENFAADAKYLELMGSSDIIWESGSIDVSTGEEVAQNNRIRTKYAYRVKSNLYNGVASGYKRMAVFYDIYGNVVYRNGFLKNSAFIQNADDYFVRFIVAKSNDSAISVDGFDFSNVMIPLPSLNAHTYNYGIDFNADNVKVADIYKHLHDLTFRHSNYITETTLGMDASNEYEIRAYTLGNGSKKIFIVGGQHGPQSDPWDSVITITRFITQVAETTYDSAFVDKLRDEYTLYIVPMCNPYGLDHYNVGQNDDTAFIGGRHNYNGVNLNRDWGVFSQPETTLVNALMVSVQPDAVMDVHTLGDFFNTGSSSQRGRLYASSGDAVIRSNLSNTLASKVGKLYNCGLVVENNTTATTLKQYAETTLGAYSMTIECNWWVYGISRPHSAEIESANMSLLVNSIAMFVGKIEDTTYVYEKVPFQHHN